MRFHHKQLPDGRWGIYEGLVLLATIECPQECQRIIEALIQRQFLKHKVKGRRRRKSSTTKQSAYAIRRHRTDRLTVN